MQFDDVIKQICDDIITSQNLPDGSIGVRPNYSRGNNSKITSYSVCIFEPVYPPYSSSYGVVNTIAAKYGEKAKKQERIITIDKERFSSIPIPDSALKTDSKTGTISFDYNDDNAVEYIRANIIYCLDNFKPSASFGCCGFYEQCSDMKKCIHANLLYSKGCKYRKSLENGIIFYGKNKNNYN